jgi:hypothetical protein
LISANFGPFAIWVTTTAWTSHFCPWIRQASFALNFSHIPSLISRLLISSIFWKSLAVSFQLAATLLQPNFGLSPFSSGSQPTLFAALISTPSTFPFWLLVYSSFEVLVVTLSSGSLLPFNCSSHTGAPFGISLFTFSACPME